MTTTSRLGVITGRHAPELSDNGQRLVTVLDRRGIAAEPVRWDDTTIEWGAFDAVLFRPCWEYPTDVVRFRALLDELEHADVSVLNPLDVIRWNMHKSYLVDLADAGAPVPPTTVIEQGTGTSLQAVLDWFGWDEVVIKPGIGSYSRDVQRVHTDGTQEAEGHFQSLVTEGDVVVQQFVPEITEGERSIVFFDGKYSHAWNSLTTNDDITDFDGHNADYEPPSTIRAQARAALDAAMDCVGRDTPVPYARVDYAHRDGGLLLMEVDMIEPFLGLERGTNTAERFATAIEAHLDTAAATD